MSMAVLVGCTADDAVEPDLRLTITVSDDAGVPLGRFMAIVDPAPKPVIRVDCSPGGEMPPGAECGSGRVVLTVPTVEGIGLTVKAFGYRTARSTVTFDPGGFPDVRADVFLEALPTPEATSDFRTGYEEGSGLQDFLAMAYPGGDDLGPSHVVKFFLEGLDGEPVAWFQNTRRHPLHYDFVNRVLQRPVSRSEFEQATYRGADRTQMAGSLILRPDTEVALDGRPTRGIVTVEWFPSDDLTPALAARAFLILEERMPFLGLSGGEGRLVYIPAGSVQEGQAFEAGRDLAAAGVTWIPRDVLFAGITEQRLNPAVSFGTLRRLTPDELETAAVSYSDIVLLTRLPNDLPLVGGTITEELQTPLAHVNVAALARGTPNLALVGASEDPRVKPFIGRRVRFEVTRTGFTLTEATPGEVDAFWRERLDRPLRVPESDLDRAGLPDFDELGFDDAVAVGVKAANLAEMRDVIPDLVPGGFAVPFRHYQQFVTTASTNDPSCEEAAADCGADSDTCKRVLAFCMGPGGIGGETLQGLILRLLADTEARTDSAYRGALLDAVRNLFCLLPMDPGFAASLDDRARDMFGSTPLRLRSSSNAEDLRDFNGAGLYESVGAALGTDRLPSRRICLVWGSLWSWKAFEERSFWNVDHGAVRMAVAVHRSFPDEQANGVLITRNISDPFTYGMYVNVQKGEMPVTNPKGGAVPEVFVIVPGPDGVQVARQRFSSLSPGVPLLSGSEVAALFKASDSVLRRFAPLYSTPGRTLDLDIEFKFHGPERDLILKQARPYRTTEAEGP
jgi:hypothetical protein